MILFLKPVFSTVFVKFFLRKKSDFFLNFDKVSEKFLKKKCFHLFDGHLQQNWRAEVGGRLVFTFAGENETLMIVDRIQFFYSPWIAPIADLASRVLFVTSEPPETQLNLILSLPFFLSPFYLAYKPSKLTTLDLISCESDVTIWNSESFLDLFHQKAALFTFDD